MSSYYTQSHPGMQDLDLDEVGDLCGHEASLMRYLQTSILPITSVRNDEISRERPSDGHAATAQLLGELRHERDVTSALEREISDLTRFNTQLREHLGEAQHALHEGTHRPASAHTAALTRAQRQALWSSDEAWLRHEIFLTWVAHVSPSDRDTHPLPAEYAISPRFVRSVDYLNESNLDKALKAVVDVLTDRVSEDPAREMHPLRTSSTGSAPARRRRLDGATCYRIYIEQNVPASRRLRFWKGPSGIELEQVVSHSVEEP